MESDILFLSERLSDALFIGQPLQRLSSEASQRPQKNRRTFCDDYFHSRRLPPPGAAPGRASRRARAKPPGQSRAQAVTGQPIETILCPNGLRFRKPGPLHSPSRLLCH